MKTGLFVLMTVAGLTSALCYVAVAFGPPLAFAFAYVAPLPILIAGLGWGVLASSGAAAIAVLTSVLITSVSTGAFYLVAVGGPAIWLSHLAVLGRPAGETSDAGVQRDGEREWYPLGRLLIWAAFFGGSSLVLTFARLGFDLEAYAAPLKRFIEAFLMSSRRITAGLNDTDKAQLIDGLAYALPLGAALFWTATILLNLWLAGKIVKRSGQLPRPWPDLAAIDLPKTFLAAFCIIFGFSFLSGGAIGYVAAFYGSAFSLLWVIIGLAVLHTVTRNRRFRGPLLTVVYITLIFFGWPALLLMLVGIAEQIIQFRRRFGRTDPNVQPNH